jgi:hypothetical protein
MAAAVPYIFYPVSPAYNPATLYTAGSFDSMAFWQGLSGHPGILDHFQDPGMLVRISDRYRIWKW